MPIAGIVRVKHICPREAEVLDYLSQGYSSKQIAEILTLEVCTVKNHLAHARKKVATENPKRELNPVVMSLLWNEHKSKIRTLFPGDMMMFTADGKVFRSEGHKKYLGWVEENYDKTR